MLCSPSGSELGMQDSERRSKAVACSTGSVGQACRVSASHTLVHTHYFSIQPTKVESTQATDEKAATAESMLVKAQATLCA